ncbi:hypothetical protein EVA_09860 [gut metagenome]|uniref:Uncharacterized protein n=1 Tax=gut metagenome TaxID=749906 RepID=J9G5B8_9ZZZZ
MQNTITSTGLLRYVQACQSGGGLKSGKRKNWCVTNENETD